MSLCVPWPWLQLAASLIITSFRCSLSSPPLASLGWEYPKHTVGRAARLYNVFNILKASLLRVKRGCWYEYTEKPDLRWGKLIRDWFVKLMVRSTADCEFSLIAQEIQFEERTGDARLELEEVYRYHFSKMPRKPGRRLTERNPARSLMQNIWNQRF